MSKSTFGWRQAGFTAVATALVFGGTLVGAGAASAAATTFTAVSVENVDPGQSAEVAGNLNYEFDNSYNTNSSVTFTIAGNDCSTIAKKNQAIGFNLTKPAIAFTTVAGSATPPVATPAGGTLGSTGSCGAYSITDTFTVNIAAASSGDATDRIKLALTAVKYDVGSTASVGNVTVNATGVLGSGSAVNARVVGTSFSYSGFKAVTPSTSLATSLGTATIAESAAGATFNSTTPTIVTLTLAGAGTPTLGGTPTVTASAGHAITGATVASNALSYTVTTSVGASAATITVSGLTAIPGTGGQLTLDSNVPTGDPVKALNVVSYNTHVGGSNRYGTAAKMYRDRLGFDPGSNNSMNDPGSVVLSNGLNYPDALSASYLAGQVENGSANTGTGILLTNPHTLSPEAYNAIIAEHVGTVYITGGVNAVSQAIQDKLEATNVDLNPFAPKINVVRLFGQGRYETNKVINDSETNGNGATTVLVATGDDYPDALGLGSIANSKGFPLVLTKGASLSPTASAQLDDINPNNVVIAGGTDVVSQSVADAIAAKGITVSRLAGVNRSETAGQVAMWATEGATANQPASSYVRTGLLFGSEAAIANGAPGSFADALAAGPYAGDVTDVILLSGSPTSLGSGTPLYLGEKEVIGTFSYTGVNTLYGLGQSDAVSTAVLKAAAVSIQK